jgi:superfamily II DNA or RNA helicase/HKD family nuclease
MEPPPHRPSTPLSDVALFTNSRSDPQLGSELRLEMASADHIDLLCAFVQWSGIRVLDDALRAAAERGVTIRVLTTTYIGATDRRALDYFVRELGAEVRVNYDSQSTHLHAKAWMFLRNSGFPTAYVGSSNMSRAALVDGLEWNVRLSKHVTPSLLDKFSSTFATYWDDPAFAPYDPDTDAEYLDMMLAKNGARRGDGEVNVSLLDVRPYPHQQIMLDDLQSERETHNRHQNLLIAATGTGKTVVAALDYKRLAQGGQRPSLLFIAHRKEILEQALRTYRDVLKDGSFGELFVDGTRPIRGRHVFASVQSMSRDAELEKWDPGRFDVVVVDEFHHAEAVTYRRLLDHFTPRELLGLTATPERADGVNVANYYFDGRVASELRLWDALKADLLVPFHYFGIADGCDLQGIRFTRGRYDLGQLSAVYTGNDARARIILQAVADKVTVPSQMKALGFCVSVDHARYMADVFNAAGIPSLALSGESRSGERREGLKRLRDGELACIFAVDLFNEGLDIPMIDTVLMLRPTQSATIFLQQLGRGLRRTEGKAVLTVLDFVGLQNETFRFDLKYRALTGLSRNRLEKSIRDKFPFLPPGSQIVFDEVAEDIVLHNVKQQLRLATKDLVVDVRQHLPAGTEPSSYPLGSYLTDAERSMADVYGSSDRTFRGEKQPASWKALVDWAFPADAKRITDPQVQALFRKVSNLAHVDDQHRLDRYRELLTTEELPPGIDRSLSAAMLYFTFWPSGHDGGIRAGLEELRSLPDLVKEVQQVLDYREATIRTLPQPLPGILDTSPLRSHAQYSREELLAGLGLGTLDPGTPGAIREGVKWMPSLKTDALLVTLKKSEADYSPTTLYHDYAINQELFHWESQSTTNAASPTGLRYRNHREQGSHVVLFVRRAKTGDIGTEPYTCLGTAQFQSSEGSRPMQIVWKLDRPAPVELYLEARAAA